MCDGIGKMSTMEVVTEVARRMGCYQKDARELLDHFSEVIAENIASGRKVQYAKLGIFYPDIVRCGRGAGKKTKVCFRPAKTLVRKVFTAENKHFKKE